MATDPVCGMEVDSEKAPASAIYRGAELFFCAEGCKDRFKLDPEKYVETAKGVEDQKESLFKRMFRG